LFDIWKDDYSGCGGLSEVKNSAGDNTLFMMGWKLVFSEVDNMKSVISDVNYCFLHQQQASRWIRSGHTVGLGKQQGM